MTIATSAEQLLQTNNRDWWAMPAAEVAEFQLALLRERFTSLSQSVETLGKMAKLQHIDELSCIDDVIPLLFKHTVYKSYPMSFLVKGRFQALTQWLDKLTAHDLSAVDASDCRSIDSWFQLLDDATPLAINHSSGTSGKHITRYLQPGHGKRRVNAGIKRMWGQGMQSRSQSSLSITFSTVLVLARAAIPERAEFPITTRFASIFRAFLTITLEGLPCLIWILSPSTPQILVSAPLSARLARSL